MRRDVRQNPFKTFFIISLSFMVLALFFKPYHTHSCGHSTESQSESHNHSNDAHSNSHDKKSDCSNDCACPQHRMNGCNPITVLTKNDRLILLEPASQVHKDASFSAKQSPILDGPFQPPRA
jgi:hypothetical protein